MTDTAPAAKGTALVTGAAQGIGRAIALRLAADGYDVALNDVAPKAPALAALEGEVRARGRRAHVVVADVAVEAEVRAMVAGVVGALGGLDVMVANAGVVMYGPFFEVTTEEWDRLFAINVRGVMLCYRYAGEQMVRQGRGGRIIGASSLAGKQGRAWVSAYCATKFAVRGLTQAVAQELGRHGITVNAYAPGGIYTDMLKTMEDTHTALTGKKGEFYERLEQQSAMGYNATAEEVASLVSYLASKEAHFITGQSMSCNGGVFCD